MIYICGSLDFTTKPYAVSSTANKFVVTGCNHYGLMETKASQVPSCVALCTKEIDLLDGTCLGTGCCQAPIPMGLQKFRMNLQRINSNSTVSSGNCSYGFVVERSSFMFRGGLLIFETLNLLTESLLHRLCWTGLL